MAQEGTWADSAVVLATANAFNVEMQIVSADSPYIAPISPTSGSPSQTIFLGIVDDFHYVLTANIDEPQLLSYGGTINDGMSLMYTDCVDCPLTWLENFYERNYLQKLFESNKDKFTETLISFMFRLKGGNSAEAKRFWLRKFTGNHQDIFESEILFSNQSDISIFGRPLKQSSLSEFIGKRITEKCSNKKCIWKVPVLPSLLNGNSLSSLKDLETSEECLACGIGISNVKHH